ncbi:MAG: hypothetical protein PHG67_01145 [Bacteroidales bacterium]|jgi:hypothetical protein|nr:hypothetical protein [Bacteroidales bacterium]
MKMLFKLFVLLSLITFSVSGFAQSYDHQLGARFGLMSGFTAKVVKNETVALHGTLGFRTGGVQLYGLIEKYTPIFRSSKYQWYAYFGGGAHFGFVNGYNQVRRWSEYDDYKKVENQFTSGFVIGPDAVLGIEFHIPGVPLIIFSEIKPFVELQSFNRIYPHFYDFGVGLTYQFVN